jgi:DNA-binding Lrp family transcriptional regulator
MDLIDFAIYRSLSPGGEARFWAGRRVIDPSRPARAIAEEAGISENAVRARLRGMTQRGYLRGRAVTPNPFLFGARVFVAELPVKEAGEVERIYRDLALVDGVVFARDTLDEGDREVRVHFAAESDSVASRRGALLRRLSPTGQLRSPQPYWIPPSEHEPTPLDWRILQALCQHPDSSPTDIARTVKVSLKTSARRVRQLVDSRACWWTHGPDAEEFPLALVRVELRAPKDREEVAGAIAAEATPWMPVASDGLGLDPATPSNAIVGLVPADSPVLAERLVQKLAKLPGVGAVRRTFALGSKAYPSWFADRIAEHVARPA